MWGNSTEANKQRITDNLYAIGHRLGNSRDPDGIQLDCSRFVWERHVDLRIIADVAHRADGYNTYGTIKICPVQGSFTCFPGV